MSARWLTTDDAAEWRAALPASRSAFGSVELARAIERTGGPPGRLLLAAGAAVPFALRDGAGLPFAAGDGPLDAATPPFTGPYALGAPQPGAAEELAAAVAQAGVVAEFQHIHPFAAAAELVAGREPEREVVWVDVTLDDERLWRESYSKACRKNVRRAEREGVRVRAAESEADVVAAHRIYLETMERRRAAPRYLFGPERFLAIFEEMPERARFALAERDGRLLAATLYLHDDEDVYSYLGGADHDFQGLRPTNAVVHDTIRWARAQGKRRLILGGGRRPGDGIFRFKASFSPERATLELERRIEMPRQYRALVERWRTHHGADADPGDWFPAYRAEPASAPAN